MRQRGSLRSPKCYPNQLKSPVKVTQKQMWFDLIATRTPPEKIDQQPMLCWLACGKPSNLKNVSELPLPPLVPCLLQQRPQAYSPILGGCLPCPRYKMQAKIASSWGPLGAIGDPMLSSLFTGPLEINKRWWLWLILEPNVL